MSNYEESANKVVLAVKKLGLYKPKISEEEIKEEILQLSELEKLQTCDPMLILDDVADLKGRLYIALYDDCNAYQEPGYYTRILEKCVMESDSDISISNIVEDWDESNVSLSFFFEGKKYEVKFDVGDTHDNVPEEFTELMDKLLMGYSGEKTWYRIYHEYGIAYHYLPKTLVAEFNNINSEYKPSF